MGIKAISLSERPASPKPKVAARPEGKPKAKLRVSKEMLEKVTSVFRRFDTDGNGTIEKSEFKSVMQKLDPAFTDENVEKMFAAADVDSDNALNFEEMLHWIFSADECAKEFCSV